MPTKRTTKKAPEKSGAIQKLEASPLYPRIMAALQAVSDGDAEVTSRSLEMIIHYGLRGPLPHERLTKPERKKVASKIAALSEELAALLLRIHGESEWYREWPGQFQSALDLLALESTLDFKELAGTGTELADSLDDENGEAFHAARYATYHILMDGMPEILQTLANAAKDWEEYAEDPPLAKPNHKNAARLYFLRKLTSGFVRTYGKPMRELTLNITSIYFDCSDLEESALSNIAPVTDRMKKAHEMEKRLRTLNLSHLRKASE